MRKILAISIFILLAFSAHSQELQFSQHFGTSIYLNPAFSAIYVDPTIFINHRRPVDNGPSSNQTSQLSATLPLMADNAENTPRAGLGLMAYNHEIGYEGYLKMTGVMVNYAHNFSIGALNTEVIAIGVQGGFENLRYDGSELRVSSQYNPYVNSSNGFDPTRQGLDINDAVSKPIANAGIMYYYNRERNFNIYNYSAFSGLAVTNLNRPNSSFSTGTYVYKLPMLFKYHGGIEFKVGKSNILPNILIQYQQGNYQADGGFFSVYSAGGRYSTKKVKLIAGAWYRLRDAFIFMGGVNYDAFSVKVSYDMNTNIIFENTVNVSRNHVEISLQYNIAGDDIVRKVSNPLF